MPTIKEQCEKRIRELVPELQELKFGCEVEINIKNNRTQKQEDIRGLILYSFIGEESETKFYEILGFNRKIYNREKGQFKVIGKEIHPESILLAIEKVTDITFHTEVKIELSGSIGLIMSYETGGDNSEYREAIYNLSDSFANQKEQVFSFLLEIIK